jgi:DNA-binding transcriptional ArsR family regulator
MAKTEMTVEQLALVAERFRALGEPTRLRILQATGLGQANVSKHLQLLHAQGFVSRRKDGPSTLYQLADAQVLKLCDLVCHRLEEETDARREILKGR